MFLFTLRWGHPGNLLIALGFSLLIYCIRSWLLCDNLEVIYTQTSMKHYFYLNDIYWDAELLLEFTTAFGRHDFLKIKLVLILMLKNDLFIPEKVLLDIP